MAFSLKPKSEFWAEVQVTGPDGSVETLPVLFAHKSRSDFDALMKKEVGEVVREVVKDWKADEPFTQDRFAQALDEMPWLLFPIFRTYGQALAGAVAKN